MFRFFRKISFARDVQPIIDKYQRSRRRLLSLIKLFQRDHTERVGSGLIGGGQSFRFVRGSRQAPGYPHLLG
jgi:hypothetical protein